MFIDSIKKALIGDTVFKSDIDAQYQANPSFSRLLPWGEWSDKHNLFLHKDGFTPCSGLEVSAIACESMGEDVINELHANIAKLLASVVPAHDESPWCMQVYVQDTYSLDSLYNKLVDYIKSRNSLDDALVQEYLSVQKNHFKLMCKDEGLFVDPSNNLPFRGRIRRTRIMLYRKVPHATLDMRTSLIKTHKRVVKSVISNLRQSGLSVREMQGRHFYDWWVRWFNPRPNICDGDVDKVLERFAYKKDNKQSRKPYGWSFDKNIFFGEVKSYNEEGWIFSGLKHKVLQFKELQNDIAIGVISRERDFGAKAERYALLDKLPPGSIFTTQIFFESKKSINNHLSDLEAAAVGQGAVVGRVMQNINTARDELEANNTLLRTSEAIYIRGEDDEELFEIENNIRSLLESSNLSLQASSEDIRLMDSYLRFLPFNYDYEFEQRYKRGSYKYADDVAKIIPVYGRFRGDGQNPLQIKFNRAGEPVIFDFLNKNFKSSNSHVALIGTSGSGKSVEMNSMIVSLSAVYNPHIIALEVGGSFDITAEYLKEHGRSVRRIKFDPKNVVPQNPYAESYKALEIIEKREKEIGASSGALAEEIAKRVGDEIEGIKDKASDAELECAEERDLLSEMLLATRIAITGGKAEEEAKLTRADLSYISQNLISTARRCRDSGIKQMRLSHVKQGFELMAENEANQALSEKFRYFAATLDLFISDQIKAPFVDRESEPLGDYDFMQIDFGFMQDALYEDLLNMTCISILGRILSLAEANKDSGRPTILLLDEAHILFKSPMIAAFITLMTKVSRKIGLWIIAGTQNIEDFTGVESKKVLSMLETWILLSLDQSEIKLVEKFKTLTDEMRYLLKSVKKVQGLYSEGVLIGKRYSGLFRNIPPRLNLALAMTEQSERTERRKIKEELGVSELEAVKYIAKKLESPKERSQIDGDFYD